MKTSLRETRQFTDLEQEIVTMSVDTEILHQGDPVVDSQNEVGVGMLDDVFQVVVISKVGVSVTIKSRGVFRDARSMNL